jgi:hypothetical protein
LRTRRRVRRDATISIAGLLWVLFTPLNDGKGRVYFQMK